MLAPGLPEVLGRADQPPGPRRRLQGERGGPLQRGRGRGRATAEAGPAGRRLQRRGGRLIRADRGRGQMPGPPVGVEPVGQHRDHRLVDGLAGREGGALVDGRGDQREAEPQLLAVDFDQPGPLGRLKGLGAHAKGGAGRQHGGQVANVLGRRDQEQRLGLGREPPHPGQERPLRPGTERQPRGQQRAAVELVAGQDRRKLRQGQRVPVGLVDQPVADLVRDLAGPRLQELTGGLVVEPTKPQRRQAGRVEPAAVALPGGEQQHDRLGDEPPPDERQCVGRRPVQPLRVGEQAQ